MVPFNWLGGLLVLAVSTCMAGISGAPSYAGAIQDGDAEFSVHDETVRGFARIADDGYLEIIHNRAFGPLRTIERYPPGSDDFLLFTSALGGLRPGEVKRVPNYSGLAFMASDGTIRVRYVARGGDAVINPPPSFSYLPSDFSYSDRLQMYRLRNPGDGYLIP